MRIKELIIDNFAGGGGASTGIEAALGRPVDLAVNHDAAALAMHLANHPDTHHLCEDVFDVNPVEVTDGQPIGLAWFSPDCTFHSKARGGKPFRDRARANRSRGLAWVVIKWAATARPRVIMLENVEEFQNWGPLDADNRPCPRRKGLTFRRWIKQLENLGYEVQLRELRASHYGAPTIRKRLFVIARCDGQPIIWPRRTHGEGHKPYRTAAECMDFSLPCPSIFTRKKPLVENTMRRIARGIYRYVIDAEEPFIIPTAGGLVAPTLINTRNGERPGQAPRIRDMFEPLPTVTASGSQGALVATFLAKHYGGHETPGAPMAKPMSTITAVDHHALVTSHLVHMRNNCYARDVQAPIPTLTAGGGHLGEVRAFLLKYYGTDQDPRLTEPMHTLTTKSRFGLVTVHGQDYQITDIGMRMLSPRELFSAQGFGPEYIIDPPFNGKPMTKTNQVRMVGNSVPPPMAEALVRANFADVSQSRATA